MREKIGSKAGKRDEINTNNLSVNRDMAGNPILVEIPLNKEPGDFRFCPSGNGGCGGKLVRYDNELKCPFCGKTYLLKKVKEAN